MMNNNDYKNMLNNFRTNDLQTLLGTFGKSIVGEKSELKDRAIKLLRSRSAGFNKAEYKSKIHEIYCSFLTVMSKNNAIMNHNLLQTQQRQMMGQIQAPQQRMLLSSQQMHVVSQVPLSYDMQGMTVKNNSYTPSPETVAQIKFKKLPFYEVLDVVLKPTILDGTDRCTLKPSPRGTKESQFNLFLPDEAVNIVAISRDVSPGKNDYPYQFQIRISQLVEPMSKEVTDFMPLGLNIRLGGQPCPLPPKVNNGCPRAEYRRSPRPINCTQLVKLSPITANIININWIHDRRDYIMAMYLVKRLTSETLIQQLKAKGGRSSEETKNYIIEKLTDVDPDFSTTSYRFSLVCPLGKIRMKIPAKSIHCDHLQCFDAISFFLMNEKMPTWVCPICNKPCLYDDIQIENYFLEVVSSPILEDNCKQIELLADGTWIVYEEKTTNSTLKPNDSVNLDSDEEKSVDITVELNSETVTPPFVDLTFSDGEEEPPKKIYKQENEGQAADAIQPVAVVDLKPQVHVQPQQAVTSSKQGEIIEIDSPSPPSSQKTVTPPFVDLTFSDGEEEPPKKIYKQENEGQAADAIQPVAVVDLKPQVHVQPQQAVTSSEQGEIIEIDSPSPPSSQKTVTPPFVDLTFSDGEEEPPKKIYKQENEGQAADAIQPVAVVDLKPQVHVQPQQAVTSSEQGEIIEIDNPSPPSSQKTVTPPFVDLTFSDGEEEPPKKIYKQENEGQAADAIQPVAVVDLKPQVHVQPQQAVTSSEQGEIIEIDNPSPPSSQKTVTPPFVDLTFSDGEEEPPKKIYKQENEGQAADAIQPVAVVDLKPQVHVQPQQAVTSSKQGEIIEIDNPSPPSSQKTVTPPFVDLTFSDGEEEPPKKKYKQESEGQAPDAIQPVAVVDLKPQAHVQLQQAVTSYEQGEIIEIDSPSPPSSPIHTTEAYN